LRLKNEVKNGEKSPQPAKNQPLAMLVMIIIATHSLSAASSRQPQK
jgi:hypothetical protein